jgi:hypothetical protein
MRWIKKHWVYTKFEGWGKESEPYWETDDGRWVITEGYDGSMSWFVLYHRTSPSNIACATNGLRTMAEVNLWIAEHGK